MLVSWNRINWKRCHEIVADLQDKLTIAASNNDNAAIKRIQDQIVRSFAARALAVRRILENRGKRTPGVDGVLWEKDTDKMKAIEQLKDLRNYTPKPAKRVWIDKPGKTEKRPLGIPTLFDRAVQALYLLALEPVTEHRADARSFGFRKSRSVRDAAAYIKIVSGGMYGPRFILEVDIRKFFDTISHTWLLNHIPMDKKILRSMLKAGVLDLGEYSPSEDGVPQGGIISPCIANAALDGLETELHKKANWSNLVRYADDFVVLCKTMEDAERSLQVVESFLAERGLQVHPDKTRITTIDKGFDFLGYTFREYPDNARKVGHKQGIFLVTPSKKNVTTLCRKLSAIAREHKSTPGLLIMKLNPILRGWAEHFRSCSSRSAFAKVSAHVFNILKKWVYRKHRGKGVRNLLGRYFKSIKVGRGKYMSIRKWVFFGQNERGDDITLFQIGYVTQKGHVMIRLQSDTDHRPFNPFLKEHKAYFLKRATAQLKKSVLLDRIKQRLVNQQVHCTECFREFLPTDAIEVHHIVPLKDGGRDTYSNLVALHQVCHRALTARSKSEAGKK